MLTGRTRAACIALLAPLSSSPPLPSHPSPSEAAAHGVGSMRGAVQLSAAAVAAHPLRAGARHPARLRQPRLALRPALRPPRPAPRRPPLRPHRPGRLPARPPQALHRRGGRLNRRGCPHSRILRRPRPHLRRRHHPGEHAPRGHLRLPRRILAARCRQQRHAGALQGLPRGPHRSVLVFLACFIASLLACCCCCCWIPYQAICRIARGQAKNGLAPDIFLLSTAGCGPLYY